MVVEGEVQGLVVQTSPVGRSSEGSTAALDQPNVPLSGSLSLRVDRHDAASRFDMFGIGPIRIPICSCDATLSGRSETGGGDDPLLTPLSKCYLRKHEQGEDRAGEDVGY